jgi:hypothetical protein
VVLIEVIALQSDRALRAPEHCSGAATNIHPGGGGFIGKSVRQGVDETFPTQVQK